ncbi:hypothetical protein [Pseudolysinimonas sp.]|jgi:hypothetical protein|uniref:hypothetical protein n=1 Tax=Pseudolysinimonas sp. TaxID=2680009 RepID=UPI0037838109
MTAIPLPAAWFDLEPLTGDDATVRGLLRDPAHPLVEAVRRTPTQQGRELAAGLRSAIGAHAEFTYPAEHGAVHAVAMLAAWIGPSPESIHEDLGGTVTIVRSGLGHRDDQQWHTDSTPWWRPNAMTLLGHVHLGLGFDAPATELLPLVAVDEAMAAHPAALQVLRSRPVPWRSKNFADRKQFSAPILSLDLPRWVGSVVAELDDEFAPEMRDAVAVFRATIADLSPVQAVVEPGRLVMFDNRTNLHRGPHIEPTLDRRLIRIKLGGAPD